jgi:multidrug efflux pump subunit AcrA (membrane-fusion protein)
VWVLAEVYEFDLPWLRQGQGATVQLPYAPGVTFPAQVDYIYPYLQGETRTQQIRLELDNPRLELRPEMYVNVLLEASSKEGVVAVPVSAVLYSGLGQRVFVHLGAGRFEPRSVEVGLQSEDGWIEIVSGVREGEIVVTSAQFMLDSESRLQEAIQKMRQPRVDEPPPAHEDHEDLEELFN